MNERSAKERKRARELGKSHAASLGQQKALAESRKLLTHGVGNGKSKLRALFRSLISILTPLSTPYSHPIAPAEAEVNEKRGKSELRVFRFSSFRDSFFGVPQAQLRNP
jgi:hypothetical protein